MKRIGIFCGSNPDAHLDHLISARRLGQTLGHLGIELVYGGSRVGIMGAVVDAAQAAGGSVIGVVPRGHGDEGLPDLRTVGTIHECKTLIAELSDAFLALADGLDSLEEFFEVVNGAQTKKHRKPGGILNGATFYGSLLGLLDEVVEEHSLRRKHRDIVFYGDSVEELLEKFATCGAPQMRKWLDHEKLPRSEEKALGEMVTLNQKLGLYDE